MKSQKKVVDKDRLLDWSVNIIHVAELLIVLFLAILAFLSIAYLFSQLFMNLNEYGLPGTDMIYQFIDIVLVIFIIVEIFRIAVAYLVEHGVFYAVIEAALVAVGRQIVIYKYSKSGIYESIALAVLMLVLVLASMSYQFAKAKGIEEESTLKMRKKHNKS